MGTSVGDRSIAGAFKKKRVADYVTGHLPMHSQPPVHVRPPAAADIGPPGRRGSEINALAMGKQFLEGDVVVGSAGPFALKPAGQAPCPTAPVTTGIRRHLKVGWCC